ncbi:MAG: STAS domain-containing protein [Chloroflexi bacterium]|nr:STAS domain-containing protein [Chloroflexota bacterium]MBV9597545.1 STAS domain-containing protein [Chloroflexota bacterium]
MDIKVVPKGDGIAVAEMVGDLNLLCAADVRARLATAVGDGQRHLVVDLGQVDFIDSSGLGALISGLKSARQAGGDLRIARPGEQARVVLKLTTLDRVLRPYESVEDALEGF